MSLTFKTNGEVTDSFVTFKKKLSTYLSDAAPLQNVSAELLFEVLKAWEGWTGTATEFYRGIGFSQRQMAKLTGKAKKMKRDEHFGSGAFMKRVAAHRPLCKIERLACSGTADRIGDVTHSVYNCTESAKSLDICGEGCIHS